MGHKCLNCNEDLHGNYCSNCGQASSTHRFSLSHFFAHDFVHGIFHLDKGFLFTLKALFTRPGHSIREFIQGKRVKHFNYFTAIILLAAVSYFIKKWSLIDPAELLTDKTNVQGLFRVQKDYLKIIVFLHIPVVAFFSYLLFRKTNQNYTENLVLNFYMLCGVLVIGLILPTFCLITDNIEFLRIINTITTVLIIIYVILFYFQYFSNFGYHKLLLLWRSILMAFLYVMIKQGLNEFLNFIGLKYFH